VSKIILKGYILVPDADMDIVQNELIIHIELTRQESGCLVFEVLQDDSNANKFTVYEEFVSHKAFDNHQQRVKNSNWAKVTKRVERHYQITDTQSAGLD
jgi:autoinducer 2-degrading protein